MYLNKATQELHYMAVYNSMVESKCHLAAGKAGSCSKRAELMNSSVECMSCAITAAAFDD